MKCDCFVRVSTMLEYIASVVDPQRRKSTFNVIENSHPTSEFILVS